MKQVVNKHNNAVDYRDVTDKQFILVHGYKYVDCRGIDIKVGTGILVRDRGDGYWSVLDLKSAEIYTFFSGEFTHALNSLVSEDCSVYVFDTMNDLIDYVHNATAV